ncbi:MAG: aldehyde dehydrogenase family protein [Deltaproteobacteria bacterium]|nr:aldehyde dehydrogenase family protein [Deltaproteobacteria bacterium]
MQALSWVSGKREHKSANAFVSSNPANNRDQIATFAAATPAQIKSAIQNAKKAYASWKQVPAPTRANMIANFGQLLIRHKNDLSRVITREMGKPFREAQGDVQEAIDTCQFFASEGRRLYGMTVPSEMPQKELSTYRRSLGVFACITAANFPVAVPSWYFVPALLCGNVCIWKAPEDAPVTSLYFAKLLAAAGCPSDVFQVLFGGGENSTGQWLVDEVKNGGIDKFGFTGSTEVGCHIGEVCGRHLISACLELGGKNPLVVMEDADLDWAVEATLWSGLGTAGQRCTSLGNLILHKKIKKNFLDKLLKKISLIKIGDPMHPEVLYGPMISEKFMEGHLSNLERLIKKHHRVLTKTQGRISKMNPWPHWVGRRGPQQGYFCHPTLVDEVQPDDEIYSTETFGPLFNVMTCQNLDEAIDLANGTGYGLSSAIFTQNPLNIYRWKESIGAGMTSINNSTTGAEAHLPFGGNGRSGNGSRQSGVWVLDQFTRWQAVNWDFSQKLQLAQMETPQLTANLNYQFKMNF